MYAVVNESCSIAFYSFQYVVILVQYCRGSTCTTTRHRLRKVCKVQTNGHHIHNTHHHDTCFLLHNKPNLFFPSEYTYVNNLYDVCMRGESISLSLSLCVIVYLLQSPHLQGLIPQSLTTHSFSLSLSVARTGRFCRQIYIYIAEIYVD